VRKGMGQPNHAGLAANEATAGWQRKECSVTKYQEWRAKIRFLTPAFLGGADQSGQWRTPPFKALLRQWWRIVYAQQNGFNVNVLRMREEEGRLFGNAWLEKQANGRSESAACRSLVRLRLHWVEGKRQSWQGVEPNPISHPEVPRPIGAHLYLGYGPLIYEGGTALKNPPAIDAHEVAELALAFTEAEANRLETVLWLMHLYGTVGGRSRNGWGSFVLEPEGSWEGTPEVPLRDWRQALQLDWPHCIGKDDNQPLIWQTKKEYDDWRELMRDLAVLKIKVRTMFKFTEERPDNRPQQRHWLSYPVTNHDVSAWGKQLRLPNSLRFKVRPAPGNPARMVGVIFHMPCKPPAAFNPDIATITRVWEQVHKALDRNGQLERVQQLIGRMP